MAIEKDIAIHSNIGIANCVSYTQNAEKTTYSQDSSVSSYDQDTLNALNYSQNEEKTTLANDDEEELLVTGIHCRAENAAFEFNEAKLNYLAVKDGSKRGTGGTKTVKDKSGNEHQVGKESVEAYHVIQSFAEIEGLDPKLVHQIGIEYASLAFPNSKCVVSTHMNTENLHNHIIVCAYQDNGKKIPMNKAFRRKIRSINDSLSLKYNLPILTNEPGTHNLRSGVGEQHISSENSFKEDIRADIINTVAKVYVSSWNDFIIAMKSLGYDIKEGKYVTFSKHVTDGNGNEKTYRCRDYKLGEEFTKAYICKAMDYKDGLYEIKQQEGATSYNDKTFDALNYINPKELSSLHVSRYDDFGRRRSDLEMILIFTIKVLEYVWEKITSSDTFLEANSVESIKSREKDSIKDQIDTLKEALTFVNQYNLKSLDELYDKKHEVGKALSVAKKELSSLEPIVTAKAKVAAIASDVPKLVSKLPKGITIDDLYLNIPDKNSIRKYRASIMPMTASQKRELYLCLEKNKTIYRLDGKFELISYMDAQEAINFLKGKTSQKPDYLLKTSEYLSRRKALREEAPIDNSYEKHNDMAFSSRCLDFDETTKEIVTTLRTRIQELYNLGCSISDTDSIFSEYRSLSSDLYKLKSEVKNLSKEYRELTNTIKILDVTSSNTLGLSQGHHTKMHPNIPHN